MLVPASGSVFMLTGEGGPVAPASSLFQEGLSRNAASLEHTLRMSRQPTHYVPQAHFCTSHRCLHAVCPQVLCPAFFPRRMSPALPEPGPLTFQTTYRLSALLVARTPEMRPLLLSETMAMGDSFSRLSHFSTTIAPSSPLKPRSCFSPKPRLHTSWLLPLLVSLLCQCLG